MDTTESLKNLKTVLTSEIKFIIYIITIVLGALAPYYSIKQDIALIQKDIAIINSNHILHIQDLAQQMKEQQTEIKELQKQIYIIVNKY
jgi:hypothetical protein